VNEEKMREQLDGSQVFAVELAEVLVMEAELSFREAYILVASLVRDILEQERNISDLNIHEIEAKAQQLFGKDIKVNEGLLRKSLDPESCISRRKSEGSPSPVHVTKMLEQRKKLLRREKEELALKKKKILDALTGLKKLVDNYVKR
jgi:argininosuccinate lyase